MVKNIKSTMIKLIFFGGLIIAFLSLFVDWYYYEVRADGGFIAKWSFQLLRGWDYSSPEVFESNEIFKPVNSMEVLTMSILLMVMIIICGYGSLLKNVELTNSIQKSKLYIYLNVFLVMLLGYFIVILPCTFLFSQKLYFPFMNHKDLQEGTTSFYCIGPAYLMQGAAFVMIIPQVIISVITINKFRSEQETPERFVEEKLKESKEEIAIDKIIAELNVELHQKTNNDVNVIYEQFQQQRWRKQYR